MLYFEKRKAARDFAKKQERYKVVDRGQTFQNTGRRWGVKVI